MPNWSPEEEAEYQAYLKQEARDANAKRVADLDAPLETPLLDPIDLIGGTLAAKLGTKLLGVVGKGAKKAVDVGARAAARLTPAQAKTLVSEGPSLTSLIKARQVSPAEVAGRARSAIQTAGRNTEPGVIRAFPEVRKAIASARTNPAQFIASRDPAKASARQILDEVSGSSLSRMHDVADTATALARPRGIVGGAVAGAGRTGLRVNQRLADLLGGRPGQLAQQAAGYGLWREAQSPDGTPSAEPQRDEPSTWTGDEEAEYQALLKQAKGQGR